MLNPEVCDTEFTWSSWEENEGTVLVIRGYKDGLMMQTRVSRDALFLRKDLAHYDAGIAAVRENIRNGIRQALLFKVEGIE